MPGPYGTIPGRMRCPCSGAALPPPPPCPGGPPVALPSDCTTCGRHTSAPHAFFQETRSPHGHHRQSLHPFRRSPECRKHRQGRPPHGPAPARPHGAHAAAHLRDQGFRQRTDHLAGPDPAGSRQRRRRMAGRARRCHHRPGGGTGRGRPPGLALRAPGRAQELAAPQAVSGRERPGHLTARSPHRRQDHARDRRATDPSFMGGRTLAPPPCPT